MKYRPLPPIMTVARPQASKPVPVEPASTGYANEGKLTPAQIANWRRVLLGIIGPYALLMPDNDIQAYRDKMESEVGDSHTH